MPGTGERFIAAPDSGELDRRLRCRGTDSAEDVAGARPTAKGIAAIPEFDYLVVNDRLRQAVDDVMAIIRAERLRTSRMSPSRKDRRIPSPLTPQSPDRRRPQKMKIVSPEA